MMERMPLPLFMKWQAYYTVEPFGEERADIRMGVGFSQLANSLRTSSKQKAYKPEDFMPVFGDHKGGSSRQQTDEQILAVFAAGKATIQGIASTGAKPL